MAGFEQLDLLARVEAGSVFADDVAAGAMASQIVGDQIPLPVVGQVGVCGSCMDARGIADAELVEGCHRRSMDELTNWTLWADKVLVF